jgi:hypothetical protein
MAHSDTHRVSLLKNDGPIIFAAEAMGFASAQLILRLVATMAV